MKTSEMFPSKYIAEADLGGTPKVLIMRDIAFEEVGKTRDRKPVLYFEKAIKGLVLNVTNTRKIESLYGTDTDDWMGRPVELYGSETDFQGETVACIRVRAPRANGAAKAAPAPERQSVSGPSRTYTDRDPPPIEDDDSAIPF